MAFGASVFTTSDTLEFAVDYYYTNPGKLQQLRDIIHKEFPDVVRNVKTLLSSAATSKLASTILRNTAVSIVARDIMTDYTFTDENGADHQFKKVDMGIFDLSRIQASNIHKAKQTLKEHAGNSLLNSFDAKHNKSITTFYNGGFQCHGRFLAMADSVLFFTEWVSKLDGCWVDKGRVKQYAIVNSLSGESLMHLRAVAEWKREVSLEGVNKGRILVREGEGPQGSEPLASSRKSVNGVVSRKEEINKIAIKQSVQYPLR